MTTKRKRKKTTTTRPVRPIDPAAVFVNQGQAARLLSVDAVTIRRLTNRGELTPIHVGGALRYRRADLEAFKGTKARA